MLGTGDKVGNKSEHGACFKGDRFSMQDKH